MKFRSIHIHNANEDCQSVDTENPWKFSKRLLLCLLSLQKNFVSSCE